MAKVFVSHATEDDHLATLVHGWLVADEHEAFLDHDLRDGIGLGDEWEPRLHERLGWADAVVCLITPAYLESPWCAAEIGAARARGSRLLPISAKPGLTHPLLPALQHTDLTQARSAARTVLRNELRRIDGIVGWGWPADQPPFPGLKAFDAERHRVFFGRKREVAEISEWLRSPVEQARGAALFLVGPSGCGKSSLVRAGLLPLMNTEPAWWCLPPIVPGSDPVTALAGAVGQAAAAVGLPDRAIRDRVEAGQLDCVVQDMLKRNADDRRRLLIVVDQFEELLTHTDRAVRGRFAELLRPALGRSIQLIVTLRPEFLAPLLAAPELGELPKHVHPIEPLRRDALRSVITEPARLAGLGVDDQLADRLVADTGDGQALPLLAFTLAELSADLRRGDRLRMSHYEQLNGVRGALVKQADEALTEAMAATGRTAEEVLRGLLRLVAVDEHNQPVRLRVPRDELPELVLTELRPFVDRHLLVSGAEERRPIIGVAHETFLSAWPPVDRAIQLTAAGLRARGDVERAAAQWEEKERPTSRLWSGGPLAAALAETGARLRRSEVVSERVELGPPARAFLKASIRYDRWRRWRVITVLSVLLVLALLAAGYAIQQQGIAERQQLIATSRQLIAQADAARATDPRTALRLGIAAARLAPSPAADASLVDTLGHTSYARTLEHDRDVVSVAVAPDSRTLVTGGIDGTVRLDIADPAQSRPITAPLVGHTGYLYSVAFAPDGRTVASASADNTVLLWDVSDPARARQISEPLGGHSGGVHAAVFASRRPLLATAGFDRAVLLWDVSDPTRPRRIGAPLLGHEDVVSAVAFTPNGLTMATAGFDRKVILWDVRDPATPRMIAGPLTLHTSTVWAVEFAPDGRTLASAGNDGTVGRWDVTDPAQPRGLPPLRPSRPGPVYTITFAPSRPILAAAGADRTVTLWDLANPAAATPTAELVGHTNNVYAIAFTPDGGDLVSGGADRVAIMWNLAGPPQPKPLGAAEPGHGLNSLAIAPDGRTLATGSATGQVNLWDIGGTGQPQHLGAPITGHTGPVWSVAFSADGHTLVTGGDDGSVRLHDITDPSRPRPVAEPVTGLGGAVFAVALSPDGRTLATGGVDERVRLWDLRAPGAPRAVGGALTGHTGAIYTVAFAPDGRTVASGGADTAVITWDVTDPDRPRMHGRPVVGHTGPVYSVVFAAPGPPLLASASADSSVVVWDVQDPAAPRPVGRPLVGHTGAVYRVAFAADGRTLVSGGDDDRAVLWDLTEPGQPRGLGQPIVAHTGPVNGVQLAAGASRLVTAGGDGRLLVWDLAELNGLRERAIDAACTITVRGLSPQEWAEYVTDRPYRETCPA